MLIELSFSLLLIEFFSLSLLKYILIFVNRAILALYTLTSFSFYFFKNWVKPIAELGYDAL